MGRRAGFFLYFMLAGVLLDAFGELERPFRNAGAQGPDHAHVGRHLPQQPGRQNPAFGYFNMEGAKVVGFGVWGLGFGV